MRSRQRAIAIEYVLRQRRQLQHAERVGGKLAERLLGHVTLVIGLSKPEQLRRIVDQHELARFRVGRDLGDEIDQFAVVGHRRLWFGCGQSVPQTTRSGACAARSRANGTASA